jgi:hypothetical protein
VRSARGGGGGGWVLFEISAEGGLPFEIGVRGLLCEIGKGGGGMVLCEKEREQKIGGERLQHFGKRFTKFFFGNHFPKFYTTFSGQRK